MSVLLNFNKNLTQAKVRQFIVVWYVVGLAGFLLPFSRGLFEALIPVSVLLNLFLLLRFHRPWNPLHVGAFLGVALLTIALEAIGTNTGLLFGSYAYGPSLGWQVFATPVLIGANWLVLLYGAVAIVRRFAVLQRWVPFSAGVLMVLFDFVMEPVAMATGMWDWAGGVVPLKNYLMWFVISVLLAGVFELVRIQTLRPVAERLFWAQLVFFLVLNLFL